MKHDGVQMRLAPSYGWRHSQEGDVDGNGDPLKFNYVVIVKKDTCETYEKNGRLYYDGKTGKQVIIAHGGTDYGYEVKRHNVNNGDYRWVRDQAARWSNYHEDTDFPEEIWTNQYCWFRKFLVYDGKVYTARIYRLQGQ